MEIKKLLFVTKFKELRFDALQSLLPLKDAALKHVVFLNVIERNKLAMSRTGYKKDEVTRQREMANIRFIDWAENLFEQGLEVGLYIVVGSLVSQVIKAAKKEDADLIVIGRSSKGVLEQFYSGSDVVELLRRASTPVLVYKQIAENARQIDLPFERPLLAIDWSPASLNAVEYLKAMKNIIKKIDVIHVASEKEFKDSSAMGIQKTRKQYRKKLDAICEGFESLGMEAEPHVYVGDANEEIEIAARECQSTMIVSGSSSKTAWVEKWLGSTPQTIAEKSVFPTLLIPPGKSGA
ncbi:universal stress protein [Desulfobacterales bacterium HSG16]|nr:universal stress protein [Desulfobacterales bacterium HSG16]